MIPIFGQSLASVNVAWLPITDAERNQNSPVVDKDAGVEAIFWRVNILDEAKQGTMQRTLYNYVRLKVYSEKGMERATAIEIPYRSRNQIMYIAGRTVKADGTEIELKDDAIHDRDVIRARGFKQKAKTFTMPGVEPGAIVEYRWQEILWDPSTFYLRMDFQRDIPIQKMTYFVRPLSRDVTTMHMSVYHFNCDPSPFESENNGFDSTYVENLPAFKEEPMMPGAPNLRAWALAYYYHNDDKRDPEKYWRKIGKEIYRELSLKMKASGDVKEAANAGRHRSEDGRREGSGAAPLLARARP